MKKAAALFLCVILIFAFSIAAFAEYEQPDSMAVIWRTGHIKGSNVNLRSGPGTGYPSGGLVQNGDTFNGYRVPGYYWCYCKMTSGANAGNNGYVYRDYVVFN